MAPRLKTLSGSEIVRVFEGFGFEVRSQSGSHIKLRRIVGGIKETLVVPAHDHVSKGTLKAIFNQASAYIPQASLRTCFYGT